MTLEKFRDDLTESDSKDMRINLGSINNLHTEEELLVEDDDTSKDNLRILKQ